MLVCDICERPIDYDEITHVFDWHKDVLQKWAEEHIFEWDGYDPREEALTAGERNPTLK